MCAVAASRPGQSVRQTVRITALVAAVLLLGVRLHGPSSTIDVTDADIDVRIDANNVGITTEGTELYLDAFALSQEHLRSPSGRRRR